MYKLPQCIKPPPSMACGTGVQYTINREQGNCSRDFIPAFSPDSHISE